MKKVTKNFGGINKISDTCNVRKKQQGVVAKRTMSNGVQCPSALPLI